MFIKMQRDIDQIIHQIALRLPSVVVTQLKVPHPSDDDGVWWFSLPGVKSDIHVESSAGTCPFVIETVEQSSGEALRASSVEQAVQFISDYLSAAAEGRSIHLDGERFWK